MGPNTVITTTVHSLRSLTRLSQTEHDFSVDLIITPDEVIPCGDPSQLRGLL